MGRVRRWTALLVVATTLTACGGSGSRIATDAPVIKTAAMWLDEILVLFRGGSIDDVLAGGGTNVDDVFRANPSVFDDAFRSPEFRAAVEEARGVASGTSRDLVRARFNYLDEQFQSRVQQRLDKMLCGLRLFVQNPTGNVELLRPWVDEQLRLIDLDPTPDDVDNITRWILEKAADQSNLYPLYCLSLSKLGG